MRSSLLTIALLTMAPIGVVRSSAPDLQSISPTIVLDEGTFIGVGDGVINRFLGIPFAKPPIGDLRFRLPVANPPYTGFHSAVNFGPACPQESVGLPILDNPINEAVNFYFNIIQSLLLAQSEDCLTVNVFAPANVTKQSKLPVVAWIYGGGFEYMASSSYNGTAIISRSIELGEPVIFVSLNYRLSALGFLTGKEVKAAGVSNIGLHDQRLAFSWIQKYIATFGGDPSKVTIMGESAGSISVALHMIANNGNTGGLFHGAIMESGFQTSLLSMSDEVAEQNLFDFFAAEVGCSNAADVLECLRQAPFTQIQAGMDASLGIFSSQSLNITWEPRVDGTFITDLPVKLLAEGKIADIPFIAGDCDDEGTLFSLPSVNVTTDAQFRDYISEVFLSDVNSTDVDRVLQLYPLDPAAGSPFDTGDANAVTPEYKRISAFIGDIVFQAPRRLLLQSRSGKQDAWSFLVKRNKSVPTLGSFHGSDILIIFGPGDLTDYVVNFINKFDPNGVTQPEWPQYNTSTVQALVLLDGSVPLEIQPDTFRGEPMAFLNQLKAIQT